MAPDTAGPLAGKTIVVTRPRPQADEIVERLEAEGAEVVLAPAISIRPPTDPAPLLDALRRLDEFEWVVFTSANGVDEVARRLEEEGLGLDRLAARKVAAVGPGTRRALEGRGVEVALMPHTYKVDSLARALAGHADVTGVRFLAPRADRANPVLTEILERAGAEVTAVIAYETVEERGGETARPLLEGRRAHYVTFTSASTVRGFVGQVGADVVRAASPPLRVASIGPETSRVAREEGIEVHVEAPEHTIPGLVAAILEDVAAGG